MKEGIEQRTKERMEQARKNAGEAPKDEVNPAYSPLYSGIKESNYQTVNSGLDLNDDESDKVMGKLDDDELDELMEKLEEEQIRK